MNRYNFLNKKDIRAEVLATPITDPLISASKQAVDKLNYASMARAFMTDYVPPSKSELFKYRMSIYSEIKIKIETYAKKNRKHIEYRFPEKYDGDNGWIVRKLRKDGFNVESWATGNADKNLITVAWIGEAPSPGFGLPDIPHWSSYILPVGMVFWIITGVLAYIYL